MNNLVLKQVVADLMNKQPIAGEREQNLRFDAREKLNELNIPTESEFYDFYENYFCGHIIHNLDAHSDMEDLLSPQNLLQTVHFAHEVWEIPKNYIIFTTGEGEVGYFYRIDDNSVWSCGVGEQHLLGTNQLEYWDSFYEFMVWYLTIENDV